MRKGLFSLFAIAVAAVASWVFGAFPSGPSLSGLPPNEHIRVDIHTSSEALDGLSAEEARDQIRDWLLYSSVSNAGLPADAINKTLYDVPSERAAYLRKLGRFQYGEMRWRGLPDGKVVVLIPRAATNRRRTDL